MDTFITLSILLILCVWAIIKIFTALWERDKDCYTTLNLPLDNKNKWWYN